MDRQAKILKHINKDGLGVEIGPAHKPLAPKSNGYNVHVIDHMDREGLIQKYEKLGIDPNRIEEVDFVWRNESYTQLLGRSNHYDWIIASHVIEHMPDLIGFLNDCAALLNESGVISLVVPDKRYCFDHFRPITSLSQIIDAHFQSTSIHSPGTVAEYMMNVATLSGRRAWSAQDTGEYQFVHCLQDAMRSMKSVTEQQRYIDVHAWCFVPHSFRLLIQDLFRLRMISLREVDFYPTDGSEFYVTLGKQGPGVETSRIEMLNTINTEIKAG